MGCTTIGPLSADFQVIKSRLQKIWSAGDYDCFSTYLQPSGERFYRRLGVPSGARLLDVACGSGQIALMAARDGAVATGIDIAPNLVETARKRANFEGLTAQFDHGDAESLPYDSRSFDFVVSAIGAMFAPSPDRVATELTRVCAPGGTIAMANWTADGFVGKMFRIFSSYVAPSGAPSPLLWGNEHVVAERFAGRLDNLQMSRQYYMLQYPFSPAEVVEFFRLTYGPTSCAFAELDHTGQEKLRRELTELWERENESDDENSTLVRAEYLQVIGRRKRSSTWTIPWHLVNFPE